MIALYRWNRATKSFLSLTADALQGDTDELRASADVLWIDLDRPSDEEERLVFDRFFPVHPLTLEDITRLRREPESPPHFPKVEEFADYLFVVVNPLAMSFLDAIQKAESKPVPPNGSAATQLSVILAEKVLITHHYEPVMSVQQVKAFLARHETQADRGPDYLFHLILDGTVDQYVLVLDHFDASLDEVETQLFQRPRHRLLSSLLHLKQEIIHLRKTLVYEREVLARLARGEFALIDDKETVYYRNVYDHLIRFTELVESSREMVTDLMQTHLAVTSNRLNEIMKVLAMISTVVLPMTLVAGIYGMNFKNQPEFEWRFGYPWALTLMALMAMLSFGLFKWKKWF